ncbi:MAG TPA: N-acetylmuramoyl-L-alanine amidase, partial [Thermomicrobiales bacterium]|nr:N-acetylmuramoyl-L-alanine amidase [Thermomicrobiales bacterium]
MVERGKVTAFLLCTQHSNEIGAAVMTLELASDLVELGAEVKMTRSEDVEVAPGASLRDDLKARVDIANNRPADLFISIHSNAAENTSAVGTETYVAKQASDRSKALAKLVQQAMIESPGLKDRGVRAADFYVIRNTTMPAILVET